MVREIEVDTGNSSDEIAKSKPQAVARKNSKKKRVAVFVDGSNLYFKLKTLIPYKMDFIHFRYRDLINSLINDDERVSYVGYYVGVVRDTKRTKKHDKALDLIQNQQKLFEQLRHQGIDIVKGYLLERDGRFFEKGVDVRLAVDIVSMAQEKQYDVAMVVSSDTDLIPAMQKAVRHKRAVAYVGFEHQPSLALIRYASRTRLLTRKEAETFIASPIAVRRYDE